MVTFLLTQGSGGRKLKAQGAVGLNKGLLTQGAPWKGWNVSLPGTAGNYVSAPHNASQIPSGDVKVTVYAAANNWLLSTADQVMFGKYTSATDGVYRLNIDSSPTPGMLSFVSTNGTTTDTAISTITIPAATGIANGEGLWLSAEFTSAATTQQVDFYFSHDSPTMEPEDIQWQTFQLNRSTTQGPLGIGATANLNVGASAEGVNFPFNGKIYRAVTHDNLAETRANRISDFNPADAQGASSWTSKSTGEVWTLNGTASVAYS